LTAARYLSAGLSDNSTYGYVGAGIVGGGALATTDRVTFSTGTFAAYAAGNLVTARFSLGACADGVTYGYWTGGDNGAIDLATTEQMTFSTGANANKATANLSAARELDTSIGVSDGAV